MNFFLLHISMNVTKFVSNDVYSPTGSTNFVMYKKLNKDVISLISRYVFEYNYKEVRAELITNTNQLTYIPIGVKLGLSSSRIRCRRCRRVWMYCIDLGYICASYVMCDKCLNPR